MRGAINQDSSGAVGRMMGEVRAALKAQDYPRATQLARTALVSGVTHPVLLMLRGNDLQAQGRYREALDDLNRAVAMAPQDVVMRNALGLCLQGMDMLPEAVQVFDDALAIRADFPPALYNRGYTKELMGDLAAARSDYEQALALNAGFPEPAARLASLASRRRDWPEVRARAAQALALDANLQPALLALATADMEEGDLAGAKRRLDAMLGLPRLSPSDRAIVKGMMGDLLDREDRPADAFKVYTECKSLQREVFAPRYAAAGAQNACAFVQSLIGYFEKTPDPARWKQTVPDNGSAAAGHVFLLGFPRSGTTLLEQALACHPQVATTAEKEFLIDGFREFMGTPESLDRLSRIDETAAARFRDLYWQRVRQSGIAPEGKTIVDKQPLNTVKLPLIAKLFPAARILFAVRDPRDVVLSCFRRRFQMNIDMFEFTTLGGTAAYYDAVMRFAELCRANLTLSALETRHEDLASDFEPRMRAICDFTGIPWDAAMHGFAARAASGAAATPSAPQLSRGLNLEGIGQWRRYAAQLAPVLPMLAPWVERFGYDGDQAGA